MSADWHELQADDDTSSVNDYVMADVDVELTEGLSLLAAHHYELNNWSNGLAGDERNGAFIIHGE